MEIVYSFLEVELTASLLFCLIQVFNPNIIGFVSFLDYFLACSLLLYNIYFIKYIYVKEL